MIPAYLQGKSAAQIVDEQRERFVAEGYNDVNERVTRRVNQLEMLLLVAVKDALCNADEVKELIQEGEYQAMGRAIAFLNLVLPKEA